jgi:ribosomal protein S5
MRPEEKAELRKLYVFKGTFKEYIAKTILWQFVPGRQEMPRLAPEGKLSIQELLHEVDQLDMDDVKKHELLSYSHWINTPKEEALRPMLERALAQYPKRADADVAPTRLRLLLDLIKDKMKVGLDREDVLFRNEILENAMRKTFQNVSTPFVIGEAKNILSRPIYSEVHPDMPKIRDPRVRYEKGSEDGRDQALERVSKQTGISVDKLKTFRVRELTSHFVTNQTRKGKIRSMYVLSVAGNGDGLVGIGEGKSAEFGDAVLQSHVAALRNMRPVHRYEDRTIYGEINKRVGGTTVQLSSRPPGKISARLLNLLTLAGFGVRTQALIYEIARCAGIRDLAARVGRSRNKMNTVKATIDALVSQRLPEDIARARGMKLVDLRKVYYGRTVY